MKGIYDGIRRRGQEFEDLECAVLHAYIGGPITRVESQAKRRGREEICA